MSGIIDSISTDKKFEPCAGEHCNRCRYAEDCPITKTFKLNALKTIEQVREVANKTFALESLLSQSKDKIKEFMLSHGLNELPIDDENRYYITTTPVFRIGKIQTSKKKAAAEKLIDLATSVKPESMSETKENIVKLNKEASLNESKFHASSVSNSKNPVDSKQNLASSAEAKPIPADAQNIVPIPSSIQCPQNNVAIGYVRVKMGEINDMLVELGELEAHAPSWKISAVVKKFLGKNFTVATDAEKYELKIKLQQMLQNKNQKTA